MQAWLSVVHLDVLVGLVEKFLILVELVLKEGVAERLLDLPLAGELTR